MNWLGSSFRQGVPESAVAMDGDGADHVLCPGPRQSVPG